METIYHKKRPAHEILIEYYWYVDHRDLIKQEWQEEDQKYKHLCDELYHQWEQAYAEEERLRENSKSARIAKKLEQMKLTDELISKIKLTNKERS